MTRSLAERYGPLRRVVGREPAIDTDPDGQTWTSPESVVEILECGHRQRERRDMVGPTNAVRRRCRTCRRAATA